MTFVIKYIIIYSYVNILHGPAVRARTPARASVNAPLLSFAPFEIKFNKILIKV